MLLELSKACFGKIKNNDLNCFLGFGDPSLEAQHQSSLGPIDALFGVLTGHAVPIVLLNRFHPSITVGHVNSILARDFKHTFVSFG